MVTMTTTALHTTVCNLFSCDDSRHDCKKATSYTLVSQQLIVPTDIWYITIIECYYSARTVPGW